ncbi:DsbA family protein [Thermodesulfobacteriota bacterium]
MGKGLVETLEKEFPLETEWVSYELRPEMPVEGVPLSRRFPEEEIKKRYEGLRRMGEPMGLVFGDITLTPNSGLALEASEFARDCNLFDAFHDRVFRAYFSETRDIGKMDVLLELAGEVGLDTKDLEAALNERRFSQRLADAREEGAQFGINAVPAFIINGSHKIVGAQPIETFRAYLKKVQAS